MTYKQLTIEERYQIKAYLKTGMSPKGISQPIELFLGEAVDLLAT